MQLLLKKMALKEFKVNLLNPNCNERDYWQPFFERNPWIFGHGLNYVFLDKVGSKLEAITTGADFNSAGKRVDGLLRTKAAASQYVLVEIKAARTVLLKKSTYRSGCWAASSELSDAVSQVQKTVFEFARDRFKDEIKDDEGNNTGVSAYSVQPKSYLIIGNFDEILNNDDKIACFELYRRNVTSPEIITFDELYYRAECIVENLSVISAENSQAGEISSRNVEKVEVDSAHSPWEDDPSF